jgi:5-methylcytosine-specific restriction endonuclease McrA
LLKDIQEVRVNSENQIKFSPRPNPYNPEDEVVFNKMLKRRVGNDARMTSMKRNLLRKQGGLCPICNAPIDINLEDAERHHIKPLSEGGSDTPKNTAILHKECHKQITS